MLVRESEKTMIAKTLIDEHEIILKRVSLLSEFAHSHLNLLKNYFLNKSGEWDSVEKIISWKSTLKMVIWPFSEYLKDHIEREIAFLNALPERRLIQEELKKSEQVLEHIDELSWLLDNTPIRKVPDFKDYLKQKVDELSQGISEHCQWINPTLKLTE